MRWGTKPFQHTCDDGTKVCSEEECDEEPCKDGAPPSPGKECCGGEEIDLEKNCCVDDEVIGRGLSSPPPCTPDSPVNGSYVGNPITVSDEWMEPWLLAPPGTLAECRWLDKKVSGTTSNSVYYRRFNELVARDSSSCGLGINKYSIAGGGESYSASGCFQGICVSFNYSVNYPTIDYFGTPQSDDRHQYGKLYTDERSFRGGMLSGAMHVKGRCETNWGLDETITGEHFWSSVDEWANFGIAETVCEVKCCT